LSRKIPMGGILTVGILAKQPAICFNARMAERKPMFAPQSHHTPKQRRVAELLQRREEAFHNNDQKAAKEISGEIEYAHRQLSDREKQDRHPTYKDGAGRRQ
jgi:hypothetical protein